MLEKKKRPDLKGEMDELQRASQDLSRDYGIDVSVKDLVKAFNSSTEEIISKEIWGSLQNTESNEIEKGDFDAVDEIAKKYDKTDPKILVKALKSGVYKRPLILNINDKHILVAGNTRLCTAAAMGMKPKVFIGKIGGDTKLKKIEAKEMTGASSAGGYSSPAFGTVIKKKDITKIHNMTENELELGEVTSASSSGSYDVPFGGGGTRGRKNPLKIDGPNSIYKGRAVKDKNFPKWGGPGGKFVKIKDKCKKFPYCNQGDINALELIESKEMNDAIEYVSTKRGLSTSVVKNMVLKEIKDIFI